MDLKWTLGATAVAAVLLVISNSGVEGNLVFNVRRKFGGRESLLSSSRAHDVRRHGRILSAVDLPLGGNGHPSGTGLVPRVLVHDLFRASIAHDCHSSIFVSLINQCV